MIGKIARSIGANRAVVALSVARLGDAVGNSILFIIIPLYVARLPSPWLPFPESVRVGLLISLYGLVNSALQPFAGALSDRLGRRKLLIQLGLLIMAAATLGFVLASRFTELVLLRGLQGVGIALTVTASMALMTAVTAKETRGGSMGVYTSSRMVGFAIGPLLGGILHDRFGFQAAFYTAAGLIFVGMLIVQLWVAEVKGQTTDPVADRFRVFDRALLTAGIVGTAVATFVMAADFSMLSTLENEVNARLSETATAFGVAFSAMMVTRLLFQIPLGRLSDRVGRRRIILIGLYLMAPATAALGFAATTAQLVGVRAVQGIASAAIAAPAFALAADLTSSAGAGRQMSVVTMGFGLGIALGPLIAGLLAVFFFELPFLVGAALTLMGAWVVHQYVPETVRLESVAGRR